MNLELMERQLILHEGIKLEPYEDTEGISTCLVGYNFEHRGWDFVEKVIGRKVGANPKFTEAEALAVLRADILRIESVVRKLWPEYDACDPVRQRVVIDMSFNLSYRLRSFTRTIAAFKAGHWSNCVREMYNSRWHGQVDDGKGRLKPGSEKEIDPGFRFGRADRLATMVLTGNEPADPEWLQFMKTARA